MIKYYFWAICALFLGGCLGSDSEQGRDDYFVAAYYFPNYHVDKRNAKVHGKNWAEWELVKNAKPRFSNHQQPKIPAWGYTDEANPVHMAQKINAAADHGIDAFVFDWYYYNDGLFLERGIEEGFFGAQNNNRIKFGLMWANHDWLDIHPVDSADLVSINGPRVLYPGAISPETWEIMTDYVIETYFKHPSYWLVDGAPYFSIYDLSKFVESFGSEDLTRQAIDLFRKKVIQNGFKNLHLNAVVWGETTLPGGDAISQDYLDTFLNNLGFTSTTSYVWIHHVTLDFPSHDYMACMKEYFNYAETMADETSLPYMPNVTMGWDSSPRASQQDSLVNLGYPFMGMLSKNTPERFKIALQQAKEYLDDHPEANGILNINCWNEWTEGSYLEPDKINGTAYLEAIDQVFGDIQNTTKTSKVSN